MKLNVHPLGAPMDEISATVESIWINREDKGVVIESEDGAAIIFFEDELTGLINSLLVMRDQVLPTMSEPL